MLLPKLSLFELTNLLYDLIEEIEKKTKTKRKKENILKDLRNK